MDKNFIDRQKEKLEKSKRDLEEMLKSFAQQREGSTDDWETKFPNFKAEGVLDEEADEIEEYTALVSIEQTLELKLQKVNNALKKIAEEKYGKCEVCNEDIEKERLELIPEAKTCSKHKN